MKIPEKYINEVITKYKNKPLIREMIVKDLALSYILQGIFQNIQEDTKSPFQKIIFKGGTLLSKSYLNYHRISEDLDFTFEDNFRLNKLSNSQKKIEIKRFLKEEFLPALNKICENYNLDFDPNEIDDSKTKKYCPVKSTIYLTKFNIYINKEESNPIKIEINFCDELFRPASKSKISHLNASSEHLIYPLKEIELKSYNLNEILIEKVRAIVTRKEEVHERDIYDLFLLSKLGQSLFKLNNLDIINKICQGVGYKENPKEEKEYILKIKDRLNLLEMKLEKEIKDINLIDYDSREYKKFFKTLRNFILSLDFTKL